jgi:hypothetical protein
MYFVMTIVVQGRECSVVNAKTRRDNEMNENEKKFEFFLSPKRDKIRCYSHNYNTVDYTTFSLLAQKYHAYIRRRILLNFTFV